MVLASIENLDLAGTSTSCGFGDLARYPFLRNSLRRQKEPLWIQQLRLQLQEQLRCLENRTEDHNAMLAEVQDFYRRRAEVEADYSKSMDKLVKHVVSKHKVDKRETWPGYSTYSIWQTLLSTTKKLAKDHSCLADLYSLQMTSRITELTEDSTRIFKQCKEMASSHHSELIKSLTELQISLKTYQLYYNECQHAEMKLRHVEAQRSKVENGFGGRVVVSRRLRSYEKQVAKRQLKCMESHMRGVKARNEYLLCLQSANASVQKYFSDDQHDLISNMDYNYHLSLHTTMALHSAAEEGVIKSRSGCLDLLKKRLKDVDQKLDKQNFLDNHSLPFTPPPLLQFNAYKGDEINQLLGQKSVQDELIERLRSIAERLNALRVENDEIWKTLETTDSSLTQMVSHKSCDFIGIFEDDSSTLPPKSPLERDKYRSDKIETEEFYLNKCNHYQTTNNLITRLQAKYTCIEKALADENSLLHANIKLPDLPSKTFNSVGGKRKKVTGKDPLVGHPLLFGGCITQYVQAVGEDIPQVIKSCVKMINLYGMHHQGVFRVSGSQIEINEFKNQFELGNDPLPEKVDGKDINSVAGVLKLYFRELKEPLFSFQIFPKLINFISNHSFNNQEELPESINVLKDILITSLPSPVLIVLNYLFSFLNHLSEFSDENMMDPYNLAICWAPTLVPIPPHTDQVLYQNHVTEVIKNLIIYHEEILQNFPGATIYQRCEVRVERAPLPSHTFSDDEEILDEMISEDELDCTDAVALFDFQGRTERELSFKKGEKIVVFEKVSPDWWEGVVEGREGLLPDKYISVKIRNKYGDFESNEEDRLKSTESLPLKSYNLSVVGTEDLSPMSASHPNLELKNQFCHYNNHPNHTQMNHSHTHVNHHNHTKLNHQNHPQNNHPNNHYNHHHHHSSSNSSTSSQNTNFDDCDLSNHKLKTAFKEGANKQAHTQEHSQRHSHTQGQRERRSDGNKINRSVSCEAHSKKHQKSLQQVNIDEINTNNNNNNYSFHISNNSSNSHSNNNSSKGSSIKDGSNSTIGNLSSEIDTALAEVMSSINSLTIQHGLSDDQNKHTPDLVIDLPLSSSSTTTPKQTFESSIASSSSSSSPSYSPNDGQLTNAEVFANVDQNTIKKSQKIIEKQASFMTPSHLSKLITTTITSPINPINRHQQPKKYATLGRMEAKMRQRDVLENVDVERNSFGKLRQVPPPIVKQFSTPNTSPNPPTRTSSKLTHTEVSQNCSKIESTVLPSSVLARIPKLDPTINQPSPAPSFTLLHNNNNQLAKSFTKSPRTNRTLPPNTQLSSSSTPSNNKSSYGKSKISTFEIPKLNILPDRRVSDSDETSCHHPQRQSLPAYAPNQVLKKELNPHHPHHSHHLPLSFKHQKAPPPLPETQNPSYTPSIVRQGPKMKPPLMKKPPKNMDFVRRMTLDSGCASSSLVSFNNNNNTNSDISSSSSSMNNNNNISNNSKNNSNLKINGASVENFDPENLLHISKDL